MQTLPSKGLQGTNNLKINTMYTIEFRFSDNKYYYYYINGVQFPVNWRLHGKLKQAMKPHKQKMLEAQTRKASYYGL